MTAPDLGPVGGEVVSGGTVPGVLNLHVIAGSLNRLRRGQIAVSAVKAGQGNMDVHVGDAMTAWLPDGSGLPGRGCRRSIPGLSGSPTC